MVSNTKGELQNEAPPFSLGELKDYFSFLKLKAPIIRLRLFVCSFLLLRSFDYDFVIFYS